MRDKLLDQHIELGWLFACAEKVMLQESTSYKENKRAWANETGNVGGRRAGRMGELATRAKTPSKSPQLCNSMVQNRALR
jgi:hypothetical protein